MVGTIKRDTNLAPYIHTVIHDAGITVGIDPSLQSNDYVAIKVDDYYNSQHLSTTPKSVDFVVVVDCKCNWYALYLLELKNVNGPEKLNISDIQEKFTNTFNFFLKDTFAYIFENDCYKYKAVNLFLVSDAYHAVGKFKNHAEYLAFQKYRDKVNRKDSLKVDMHLSDKLYRFRGKIVRINYDIPPNPLIRRQ